LGQNVNDLLLIGGYGVSSIVDAEKGLVDYAPLQTKMHGLKYIATARRCSYGLFMGLSENLGATENLAEETKTTGFGTDIKTLYRISPRIFSIPAGRGLPLNVNIPPQILAR
jgi:hypothetical protein